MSESVSSGIMSTASIITTVVIVVAGFVVAGSIGASINTNGQKLVDQIDTDIDILTVGDVHSGNETVATFLKNFGTRSLSSFEEMDVFLDGDYYYYDSVDTSQHRWNATILNDNGNGIWDQSETVKILLMYPSGDSISAGSHQLTISLAGLTENYRFSV